MKLFGFTDHRLNVGQVDIPPGRENPITCCDICGQYFTKTMAVLDCRHIVCQLCCIYHDVAYSLAWCDLCVSRRIVMRKRVNDEEVVLRYTVTCNCGADLLLRDFKQHFLGNVTCMGKLRDAQHNARREEAEIFQFLKSFQDNQRNGFMEFSAMNERLLDCLSKLNSVQQGISGLKTGISGISKKMVSKDVITTCHTESMDRVKNMVSTLHGTVLKDSRDLSGSVVNLHQRVASLSDIVLDIKGHLDPTVVKFADLKSFLLGLVKDVNGDHKRLSKPFKCGGVNWRIMLELRIKPGSKRNHRAICQRGNILTCEHYKLGVFWFPQKTPLGEADYFPIVKKVSFEIINEAGIHARNAFYTSQNGVFVSTCFVSFNETGHGFENFLDAHEMIELLRSGDNFIEFKVNVTSI